MNIDSYLKKVYNVAFRLTGDDAKAANLAFNAINSSSSDLSLSDKVDSNMLVRSANEVCILFLTESDKVDGVFRRFEKNTYSDSFQEVLMALNPLRRVTIVWRDILGYNLGEMNITKHTKHELYFELNIGRKQIKELLNDIYLNETGA